MSGGYDHPLLVATQRPSGARCRDEAAACAKAFKPRVLIPYHFRGSDLKVLTTALEGTGIDVRVRRWYD